MAVSIGILLLYAPIGHRNKPLEDIEILIYKRRLKWILLVVTVVFISFMIVNWITLAYAVSLAVLLSTVMLLVAKMDN